MHKTDVEYKECVAHMECRVDQITDAGDKRLFIGAVLDAYADSDIVCGQRKVEYAAGAFPGRIYGTRFS